MGISKAYTTRVGGGPFPTELNDETGERLRKVGDEFGATTGRPRRCGWLDGVVLRYAARVNGLWGLALTKLDVLSGLEDAEDLHRLRARRRAHHRAARRLDDLARVKPVYETLPGWDETLAGVRTFERAAGDRPALRAARGRDRGVPVVCISVGADRGETILLENPFDRPSRR